MSQEHQSFLRFSLEESVWFQKGQEVAELVSISLDPNITIIENDQYVAIRGSLELTGEYKRIDEDSSGQEDIISAPKFVQSVEEREEGICEFLHRFPVDITIPNNRIQSVYDIDVTVDSFDYVVPERSCLKLVAELTISGLYGEQQNVPNEDDEQTPDFIFELERDVEEAERLTDELSEVSLEETVHEEEPELEPMYRSEEREESHTYSPNFILSYPTESAVDELDDESAPFDYSQPFSAEAKKQGDNAQTPDYKWGSPTAIPSPSIPKLPDFSFAGKRAEEQSIQEEEVPPPPPSLEVDVQEVAGQVNEVESVEQESSSSPPSSEEKPGLLKKFTKKKSMSIAEFLGRKSENELQAKLKVCIVQHGDTLDSISERYALPVQQILRVNHLEANQDVYEGQVLYIPETAGSR